MTRTRWSWVMSLIAVAYLLLSAGPARAQSIVGDWQGTLVAGPVELRLVVHLTQDAKSGFAGMFDSPDQGALGIPITMISLADSALTFAVQPIGGSYEGKVNANRTTITGTWSQAGMSMPLNLTRAPAASTVKRIPKPSDIDGDWEGTLNAGASLRIVLHITTFEDGIAATMDSPDQQAFGLPATSIRRDSTTLRFEMRQIAGSFAGTLDTGVTTIDGIWSQIGNSLPLELKRVRKNP